MSIFRQKYSRHFELCDELISLALQVVPILPAPSKTYGEVVTAFFIRALNLFRSVILLCHEGCGNEAALIVRSLLNLNYLLLWTEREKEERAQRFLGWFLKERIDYIKSLTGAPSGKEQAEWDRIKHLFEDKNKPGQLVRNWYGNDTIAGLAKSLGEDAYLHYTMGYKPLSDLEHTNPVGSSAFLSRAKGHYLVEYLSSDEVLHEAMKNGFQYFYIVFKIWNDHFAVFSFEELQKLFEKAKEHFQQFQDEQAERKTSVSKAPSIV